MHSDCVFPCRSQLLELPSLKKEEERTMLFETLPLDFGGSTEVEGPTAVSLEARSSAGDASAVACANGASEGSTALVPSYTFNLGGQPPTATPAVANSSSAAGNHAGSSQAVSAGTTQQRSDAVEGAQAEGASVEGGHEHAVYTMLSAVQELDKATQQASKGLISSPQLSHPAGDVSPATGSDGALTAVAQAEADGAAAAVKGSVAPNGAAATAGASGHAARAALSGSAATADAAGHALRVAAAAVHESAAGQAALPAGEDAAASSSGLAREAAGAAQARGTTQLPAAGPSSLGTTAQGPGSRPVSGKAGRHPTEGSNSSPESNEASGHMIEGTGSPSVLDEAGEHIFEGTDSPSVLDEAGVHAAEGLGSPLVLDEATPCCSSQAPPAKEGSQVDLDDALPVVGSSPPPTPALPPAATAGDAVIGDGAGNALQSTADARLDAARHAVQQLLAQGKEPKPKVGKEAFKSTLGFGLHHTQVSLVQLQPETLQQVRQGLQAKAGLDQLPPCVPMRQPAKGQPFQPVPDDEATPAFKVGAVHQTISCLLQCRKAGVGLVVVAALGYHWHVDVCTTAFDLALYSGVWG